MAGSAEAAEAEGAGAPLEGAGLGQKVLDRLGRGLPGTEEAVRAIADDMGALEAAVLRLEEGTGRAPEEDLRAAFDLGREARCLLWLAGALSREPPPDPLGYIEEEIGRIERSARELARSHRGLQREAEAVLGRVGRLRLEVARGKAVRFASRPMPGAATTAIPKDRARESWFDARETFGIEAELASRAAASSLPLPRDEIAALRKLREAALLECGRALKEAGAERALKFFRRASAELADHASSVLSETAGAHPAERILALESLRERIDALCGVMEASGALEKGLLPQPERREVERKLRSLDRARRRSISAGREATARVRLEKFFGPRAVRVFETFILVALAAFLALIAIEWSLPEGSPWMPAVHVADIALCAIFQLDFFVRWAFARWSWAWFLRHFFLESLPALPYGFILEHATRVHGIERLEGLRAVVVARLFGLRPVLLLAVRAARVLAFFVQGSDRVVERFRRALDRDIHLFESLPPAEAPEHPLRARLLGLESRRERASRAHRDAIPPAARPAILEEHLRLLEEETRAYSRIPSACASRMSSLSGEIHLERLIERLREWNAARVIEVVGSQGAVRVRRWLRFLDLPLVRRAPLVRRLVPAGRIADPPEAVAAAGQALGEMLENLLGAVRFWSDLSGITTGPQILDRIATGMIAASRTPAFRLILFGGMLLVLEGLVELLRIQALENPLAFLRNVVGLPLLIIGGFCLAFLQVGRWFKRIAGEALDIYLRTAAAHSYSLLKMWKREHLDSDARHLHRSVLLPEAMVRESTVPGEEEWVRWLGEFLSDRRTLPGGPAGRLGRGPDGAGPSSSDLADEAAAVALLYADFLDGPILSRDDDRTASQILGNLVIQDIRTRTLRMTKRDLRKLERLNLEKDRVFTLGPYFWFRFITESLCIETSKLVLEYKTSCIPRDELHLASPEARARFKKFLEARRDAWNASIERIQSRALRSIGEPVLTDEFHALDFLAIRPEREEALRGRFGDDVVEALRRDRSGMVRDIFGTHPYHLLPRERRVINPYRLYRRYLGGARFLLLPLVAALAFLRMVLGGVAGAFALVREVLGTGGPRPASPAREAGFDVAVRKIHRMRKPFFMEALRLRAAVDLQYLGLRIPGCQRDPDGPSYREDLDSIDARGSERRAIDALRGAAVKDLRRFRALAGSRGWLKSGQGGSLAELIARLDPSGHLDERRGEVSRAIVSAFVTDENGLRSELHAVEEARELVEAALSSRESPWMRLASMVRGCLPARRRLRSALREYRARAPGLRDLTPAEERRLERALGRAPARVEAVLSRAAARLGEPSEEGDLALLRAAAERHPLWTRRVLTARAIQAITVLDMKSYTEIVRQAGGWG